MRLTNQRRLAIIAERDALKELLNLQQLDHPSRVVDVRVRKQPQLDLALVDIRQQLLERIAGLDDVVQRQRVVHLGVVLERVDLVVSDEPFDGQAVVLVVLLVQPDGVLLGEVEVALEVLVD